jgi:predicted nucleic acid-binding protein
VRVYAETNFVLELALEQEQHADCEALLELVEKHGDLELAIPAFCFAEPFETMRRRQSKRKKFKTKLDRELRELERNPRFAQETASVELGEMLVRSIQEAGVRLDSLCEKLIRVAHILPLTSEVLSDAATHKRNFGLFYPDALVLASVLLDARSRQEPSCFLNRNTKDFDDPSLRALFNQVSCKFIGQFNHGLAYVNSTLAPKGAQG